MYEINKSDEQAEQEQAFTPVIEHGMMNNWTVSVPNHSTANLNYIDWIAVETNYGIHIIQVGPQRSLLLSSLWPEEKESFVLMPMNAPRPRDFTSRPSKQNPEN